MSSFFVSMTNLFGTTLGDKFEIAMNIKVFAWNSILIGIVGEGNILISGYTVWERFTEGFPGGSGVPGSEGLTELLCVVIGQERWLGLGVFCKMYSTVTLQLSSYGLED